MSQWRAALVIAGNDLRRRLRNRSFVIQAIVGPFVLATIISLAFGSGSGFDATIALVDDDGSDMASAFVEGMAGADAGALDFTVLPSAAEARRQVADDEVAAAVVVPAGFTASTRAADVDDLVVIAGSEDSLSAEVARSVATGFTDRVNAARVAVATAASLGAPPPDEATLADLDLPVQVAVTGTGGDVSPAAYFGPAMGLLFLFLSVATMARELLTDERTGLIARLRAGPVGDTAILVGRGLSVTVVGVTSLAAIWAVTAVALGADWGDPVGVALIIVAASLAVAGIAGVVAALARTDQTADTLATMIAFVFALVGGAFIPLGDMPDALRSLSLLTPTGWALRGFAELSAGGGDVADIVAPLLVLLAWALVTGVIAARLLPRRLGGG